MTGISFSASGFDRPIGALERFAQPDRTGLMTDIGALMVSQTQRRISSEKTSPSGQAWKANLMGTSILFQRGNLAATIFAQATSNDVKVGSPMIYARVHNDGGTIRFPNRAKGGKDAPSVTMPKREFLGVSAANEVELKQLLVDWLGGLAQ